VKALDWAVLATTILGIVVYGVARTRNVRTADVYLRGGRDQRWWTIGLSIMATQASAITFLSVPGQAHEDGMAYLQFYFGLPVAMVILSATIVPLYYRLKVYTAYEWLERRFDRKTRQLTAIIFLLQRGLAAGLSIYAPAIILSTVLGWPLHFTNLVIGFLVIGYTVSGGTRAVSQTQTLQMIVMLGGMAAALIVAVHRLPAGVSLGDATALAGALGRVNLVDYSPRFDTRYTFWSGMTGGLFVALAYFGTDQSQVQRYLGGSSLTESRLGLLFNGLLKIPMQAFILFVGLMVLVFHQFKPAPLFFNQAEADRVLSTPAATEWRQLEGRYSQSFEQRREAANRFLAARAAGNDTAMNAARTELRAIDSGARSLRDNARKLLSRALPGAETQDADYVFLRFVKEQLPAGLVGLLIAVIFCAAMSATAAALNALGSTTVVDIYRRSVRPDATDAHYLLAAKGFTIFWGVVAMLFATFASLVDNLIQAVNILGSIFYGPMLGVFLVGFSFKRVQGTAAFTATLMAQAIVIAVMLTTKIGFLWWNVIGCGAVVALATLLQPLWTEKSA